MPRKKKSRKIGQIGIPSAPKAQRKPKTVEKRSKKTLGKPAGSRNNPEPLKSSTGGAAQNKDPRVGSKKPVPLIVSQQSTPVVKKAPRYFSPSDELNHIESDDRLGSLIEASDKGKKLNREDQEYLKQKMARHKELCELLGIEEEGENQEDSADVKHENDLFAQFDAIDINEFKQ